MKKTSTKTVKKQSRKTVKKNSSKKTTKVVKKTKRTYTKRYYYLFKMNSFLLNGISLVLIALCCFIFYLIYGNDTINVLSKSMNIVIVLYLPYLILHEQLHSLAYVIYGADFKNITFGAHLEKGILCCLCKQKIDKRNILHSLLYPFVIIGIITLIIGIIINYPLLVILSLTNIAGCSGDLVMFYHLRKLNNFEFSEYDDPVAFALYTKEDFSKLKMFGLDYVERKAKLEIKDLRKVVISKPSIITLILFYLLIVLLMIV